MARTKDGKRKAQSPYQKYRKSPFRYSAEHDAWFDAVIKGGNVAQARDKHLAMIRRRFGFDPFA